MSSEKHSNLGLHKWAPTDGVLRTEFNDNFGKIDENVAEVTSQLAVTTNGKKPSHSVWEEFEQHGVNVKWFGAKGDGVTDDTVALQTALNFASQRGLPVFLPNGRFKITAPLVINVSPVVGSFAVQPRLIEIKGNGFMPHPFESPTRIIGYGIPANRACLEITGATSWWTTTVSIKDISIEHDGIFNPNGFAPLNTGTCDDKSFCLLLGDARMASMERAMLIGKNALKLRCGSATYPGDNSDGWANVSLNFTQCFFRGVNSSLDSWAIKPEIYERASTGFDKGYLSDNIKFDSCYFMGGIFGIHASIAKLVNCMFYNDMGRAKRAETTGRLNGLTIDYSTCLLITAARSISIDSCYWEDLNKAIDIVPAIGGDIVSVNIDNCYINGRSNQIDELGNIIDADYGVHIRNASSDIYKVQNVTVNNTVFRDYVNGENLFNQAPIVNENKFCKLTVIDCSGDFRRETALRVVTTNKNFMLKDTKDNTAMRTKTVEFEVTLANVVSTGYDYAKLKDFPIDKYICAEKCWIQKITVLSNKQLLTPDPGVNFTLNALSNRGIQKLATADLNYIDTANNGVMYVFDNTISRPFSDWVYNRGDKLGVYIYSGATGNAADNGAKVRIILDLAF